MNCNCVQHSSSNVCAITIATMASLLQMRPVQGLLKAQLTDVYYIIDILFKHYAEVLNSGSAAQSRIDFMERLKRLKNNSVELTEKTERMFEEGQGCPSFVDRSERMRVELARIEDSMSAFKTKLKEAIDNRAPPDAALKQELKVAYNAINEATMVINSEMKLVLVAEGERSPSQSPMSSSLHCSRTRSSDVGGKRPTQSPARSAGDLKLDRLNNVSMPGTPNLGSPLGVHSMPGSVLSSPSPASSACPSTVVSPHSDPRGSLENTPERGEKEGGGEKVMHRQHKHLGGLGMHESSPSLMLPNSSKLFSEQSVKQRGFTHSSQSTPSIPASNRSPLQQLSIRTAGGPSPRLSREELSRLQAEVPVSLDALDTACNAAAQGNAEKVVAGMREVMKFLKTLAEATTKAGVELGAEPLQRTSKQLVDCAKQLLGMPNNTALRMELFGLQQDCRRAVLHMMAEIDAEVSDAERRPSAQRNVSRMKQQARHMSLAHGQDREIHKQLTSMGAKLGRPSSQLGSSAVMRTGSGITPTSSGLRRSGAGGNRDGLKSSSIPLSFSEDVDLGSKLTREEEQEKFEAAVEPPSTPLSDRTASKPKLLMAAQRKSVISKPFEPKSDWTPQELSAVGVIQQWYRRVRWSYYWIKCAKALPTHPSTKKQRKKRETIKELLSTERTYVRHLERFVDEFVIPVQTQQEKFWKDPEQQKAVCENVFRNIAEIRELSVKFFDKLVERENEFPKTQNVGDIFLSVMEHLLRRYAVYVQGFHQSVEYLDTLTNKKWAEYLKTKRNEMQKPLNSYLILPVQRLPRYEMLFEQLYNLTPDEHADRGNLHKAVKLVKEVNEDIDRQTQNRNKLISIEKSIYGCPSLVILDRYFIRSGELQGERKKKRIKYVVFLFNELLVRTIPLDKPKKEGEKYEYVDMFVLKEYELQNYIYSKEKFVVSVTEKKTILILFIMLPSPYLLCLSSS